MDTLRFDSTPYGASMNTERTNAPGEERPAVGSDSPAAEVIGKCDRVTVSLSWLRTESESQRADRGGTDWDHVRELAARSQHDGIDWDHLLWSVPHRPRNGVDWDCARDRRDRRP